MGIPGLPQLNIPGMGSGSSGTGALNAGGLGGGSDLFSMGGGGGLTSFGLPGMGSPAAAGNMNNIGSIPGISSEITGLVSMLGTMMGGLMTMIAALLAGIANGSISGTAPPGSGGGAGATQTSQGGGGSSGAGSSGTQPIGAGRNSDGSNVRATQTLEDYKERFGVTNLGIWGDEAHQKRKSDHNTGDAVDLGVSSIDQGNQVRDALLQEAEARGIKYIIFNRQIWSAERSDEGWRPYTGSNAHTSHVHVSFNA